ncbi:MAG: biotin carboxylase N-terminal domain-containing protein, partial [Kiloniellales bacterium]
KILIANRGEIACRVMRTARRLGVGTVAVYSDADANAAHVAQADEAHGIGPAPAAESYLNAEAIIAAARETGAQAVHPGYGFLAENAEFAEACAAAGLTFIGPPAAAIRRLGSKSAAKALMAEAGVPVVRGYHGAEQDPDHLARAAAEIGYPVLIKASAGGGGKGMRVVARPEEFLAALDSAQRESRAAFGDDRVLIEAYLTRPRHIEVQIFADTLGHAVHLFERDCSLQRRHQKVLEEAPAPDMTAERRAEMVAAALAATRASGYVGAGTVEFICEKNLFYFMEMNTRLQVEHPVTEMITGLDLVEWQFRIAAGEPLPLGQEALAIKGHALEARIYAEDPRRDFLPATGRLAYFRMPPAAADLRVETGVGEGDEIGIHYDPLIAKLIVWGRDRAAAVARLRSALAETRIVGVTNNLEFLTVLAAHPAFARGDVDTDFIARCGPELLAETPPASDRVLALACLSELSSRRRAAETAARSSNDPFSPWQLTTGWRLNMEAQTRLVWREGEREVSAQVSYRGAGYLIDLPGGRIAASGEIGPAGELRAGELRAVVDGHPINAVVVPHDGGLTVLSDGASHHLHLVDPFESVTEEDSGAGRVTAPMPGKVTKVHVRPGQGVGRGEPLMILEAMKMEHTISAPGDGLVAEVHYRAGDLVEEGVELLVFEAREA